jgi:hypothetical protein
LFFLRLRAAASLGVMIERSRASGLPLAKVAQEVLRDMGKKRRGASAGSGVTRRTGGYMSTTMGMQTTSAGQPEGLEPTKKQISAV